MNDLDSVRQRNGRLRASAFEGLKRAHVLQALAQINADIEHPFAPSTDYDFTFEGKRYPPKAVFGLAAGLLLDHKLGPDDFSGGESSPCFRILRRLDFTIQRKELPGLDLSPIVLVNNDAPIDGGAYEDIIGERYHYPNQYRGLVLPGRRFVYYRGVKRSDGSRRSRPEYFGSGVIGDVWLDPRNDAGGLKRDRRWYASIANYHPMTQPIAWDARGEKFEKIAPNRFAVAVRELSEEAYLAILRSNDGTTSIPKAPPLNVITEVSGQSLVAADGELLASVSQDRTPKSDSDRVGHSRSRSLRSKAIGDRGERLVLELLEKEAKSNGWHKLRWVASLGELPGWDIEYEENGQLIAVEVKATVASGFASINITQNEWSSARELGDRYRLALIAGVESSTPTIEWICDPWRLAQQGVLSAAVTEYRLVRERSSPLTP